MVVNQMRKYNDTEISILKAIQDNPKITIDQMSLNLYVSRSAITKYLKRFYDEGLLFLEGENKSNYQRILTNKARLLLTKM